MSFAEVVQWSEQSWLGAAGRETFWLFPAAEIAHFFGLCLLMGTMLVVDLRLLGFARRIPLAGALSLIPAAVVGLAINLASGIVFLCAYPENYWPSPAFRLKLVAIALGGANAVWFKVVEAPRMVAYPADADVDLRAKIVAGLSLGIWIVVIILGRFLPYVSQSSS